MSTPMPHGDFHEIWWIYSPINGVGWAGLRIAHFRKTVDGTLIFFIDNETPERAGPRVWVDTWLKEHWYKVRQIPIPTLVEIAAAAINIDEIEALSDTENVVGRLRDLHKRK